MTTHPRATRSLWFGVVGLVGGFLVLPMFLGPFAWASGARARREIAAAPGRWDGSGEATAGMVLGIITTVLLVLTVVVGAGFLLLMLVFWAAASGSS